MSLGIAPFTLQLPSGYGLSAALQGTAASSTATASTSSTAAGSAPVDIVAITNAADAGVVSAKAGDIFRLRDLFGAAAPAGQMLAGYRVALGEVAAGDVGGRLWLGADDVSDRTSFTAEEFAHLTYDTTGASGSRSIVVVAQTGTRLPSLPDGTLGAGTREVDSPAVQITLAVNGTRSINAMNALASAPDGADGAIAGIVQQAAIFTGLSGATRPGLGTDGNFTAAAGDVFRMRDLFAATAPAGKTLAGYRVALSDVAAGHVGGRLWLGTEDVTSRTSFTAEEFASLTYDTAGSSGAQNLVVVAQMGTRQPTLPDGSLGALTREVDSPAVQITANVNGVRSINAMNALMSQPTGADAEIASIVQQSGIFVGLAGATRPSLRTDGDFTAQAGDAFRMRDLFTATAPAGNTLAGYRVALGDVAAGEVGGRLWLDAADVTARTTFTAEEFARLTYDTTGATGAQNLVVVAQTGTRLPNLPDGSLGALTREVDSPAVQITASINGVRSINAMNALMTQPTGADAAIVGIVQQAGIFTGLFGAARPGLQTAGNFTAAATDVFRLRDLFKGSAPVGQTLAGYRVALGEVAAGDVGGRLWLGTTDVTARTSFTAEEFAGLTYDTTGASGAQNIVVVAQTGTRLANLADGSLGPLTREVDSPAVQITANVNGVRSINAMGALTTQPTGADAAIVGIVQQSGIFTGLPGAARASLLTDGNFTARAGDIFRMRDLFKAAAPVGQELAGFPVALGEVATGNTGGRLWLGTEDVTGRTSFTAEEFASLTYDTTDAVGAQSIVVVAQTGTRLPDLADGSLGPLTREVDSPAVQITANVNGLRSINAMNALTTAPTGADGAVVSIVQQAGIFVGLPGKARSILQTGLTPEPPVSVADLAQSNGAYRTAGAVAAAAELDLQALYQGAIGSSVTPGVFTVAGDRLATALLLLGGGATGAFRTADNFTAQAIRAYNTTKGF